MTPTELHSILRAGDEATILQNIQDGLFDVFFPGLQSSHGCSQGSKMHFEGDVAKHTAKVVSNLVKISQEDPQAQFDDVDLVAALIHDIGKVATRVEKASGEVSFPGHEGVAAERVPDFARKLGLNSEEHSKLDFLVREHGVAHSLPREAQTTQRRIIVSPYWRNLRLLQKADALGCYMTADGSKRLPVHWAVFDKLREELNLIS